MPRVILARDAVIGIARCRQFLTAKSGRVAANASATIVRQLRLLEMHPEIGRPLPESPGVRELLIDFGDSGYVIRYRYDTDAAVVHVTAFRHQREAGY